MTYRFLMPEIVFFFSLLFYTLQSSVQLLRQRQYRFFFFFQLLPYFTISKLLKSLYLLLFLLLVNLLFFGAPKVSLSGFLIASPLLCYLKILIIIFSIIILRSSMFYTFVEKLDLKDFSFFWGFLILFLLLLIHVNDFFLLFFNFEIISILLYLVIVFYKKFHYNVESDDLLNYSKYEIVHDYTEQQSRFFSLNVFAGLVYFMYNAFFSGLYLCGLSLLFIFFRSSHFFSVFYSDILITDDTVFNFFFIFMLFLFLSFFFFKLSVVPFHWWLSAVYEGSSITTLLFFAIPVKIAYFAIFVKLLFFFFSVYGLWLQKVMVFCGLLSLVVGSFGLIWQQKLKKFWAFSTINHSGYLVLALSCLSFLGFRAFVVYLFFYFITNFCFFFILSGLYNENLSNNFLYTNQFRLLFIYKNYVVGFIFSVMLFSLIGFPPLLGFWGKYLVLCSLYNVYSFFFFLFLFFIILVTTLVTSFAYLRLWKVVYFKFEEKETDVVLVPFSFFFVCILYLCVFILLFSFLVFFFDGFFFSIDLFFFIYFFDL